ncbi:MAG TPA: type II toxin-antitoxin system prevent-host-death family antitoxin [Methylocystis sp.]|jgi:prevent-host-death family protein
MLMREVQASDAKARLAELLTAVERGETIGITRHGRRIARLAPETGLKQVEIDRAIDDLAKFRERTKKAPLAEVLGARHNGHKY